MARAVFGLAVATPALEAQDDTFEQLALRVVSARPGGQCVVDLGARNQLAVDDHVLLEPRNAAALSGRVVQVEERTALVQLLDPTAAPPIGTRGHALLPKARLRPAKPATPAPQDAQPGAQPPPADEWKPGDPLLGRRGGERPPRPWERPRTVHGRIYTASNLTRTLDSFDQSFFDAGVDMAIDNVGGDESLGSGTDSWSSGTLRFHGAYNRSTEFNGVTGDDLRLFDLSYEHGGNRFDALHWRVGRFLPRDLPELGLLDGAQVGYRTDGGDRFGVTLGYLPQLDDDMNTFDDLQVAFYYQWNQDVGERVSYAIAFQRTWHHGLADRDVFVLKGRWLPRNEWNVSATAWVDVYDNRDDRKDASLELTRANLFAVRRWQGAGGIEAFYDHESYPDTRRRVTPQTLLPATLADAHVDRVSARGWLQSGGGAQWFSRLTGWADEERDGGAVELGVDAREVLGTGTRAAVAFYAMQALHSSTTGARVELGSGLAGGRLDVLYELGLVHFEGFGASRDDLLQHRLGALWNAGLGGGWDASLSADATLWDRELSFAVGIYLQRAF
ncbi:MAG: hypothetical protein H6835_15810 [Planctomycetes bacterium]|nr:hypothetical protein [Planctomycetota bacterium]